MPLQTTAGFTENQLRIFKWGEMPNDSFFYAASTCNISTSSCFLQRTAYPQPGFVSC